MNLSTFCECNSKHYFNKCKSVKFVLNFKECSYNYYNDHYIQKNVWSWNFKMFANDECAKGTIWLVLNYSSI